MSWIQENSNIYHKYESLILAIIFLLLGLFASEVISTYKENGFKNDKTQLYIVVFLVMLSVIISVIIYLKKVYESEEKNKIDELSQENNKLRTDFEEASEAILELKKQSIADFFDVSSCFLKSIYQRLGLNHKDRLSVYIHNHDKCYFSLIARYSHNTDYCKQHRQTFPDTQGVLGRVWKGEEEPNKIIKLPENLDKYYEESKEKYNMNKEEVEILSMQSRRFLVVLINENQKPIGTFLIESVRKADDRHILTSKKIDDLVLNLNESAPYVIDLAKMYLELQNRTDISKGDNYE